MMTEPNEPPAGDETSKTYQMNQKSPVNGHYQTSYLQTAQFGNSESPMTIDGGDDFGDKSPSDAALKPSDYFSGKTDPQTTNEGS